MGVRQHSSALSAPSSLALKEASGVQVWMC